MLLTEEFVDLPTPTGPMRTYIYKPAPPGRYPGLLLFSEIFQRTGPIKRTAALMAGHGFIVGVPEIFHELEPVGTELAYDQAGADKGNEDKIGKPVSAYDADARAVIAHLKALPACTGKIGSLGICVGGHLSFRASMNPEILAGACFYATDIHKGSLGKGGDDSLARTGEIKGEMLMIFGKQDPHVPGEGRLLLYKRMTEAGVNFTWCEFNGAHAFIRDEGYRYDPELAHTCLGLVIDLFRRKLGEGDLPLPAEKKGPVETKH
ncbi:MAG: dienelactone hydrolase family protein [Planctomycetes bacterium]|nr:dienelactone hydrolase family protein [Planctomycetota bacterium]